ncbi:MAG TPA: hypothetical protein PK530_07550 [Anaerolineales bacterium]|nr:hypothetical protein [Anaerolineales bacterium]
MPFGNVTQLLGIANAAVKNAASFGSTVLRLPVGFPVYQAHLVHNQSDMIGPPGGAEWCGTADNEVQHTATLREVSAHDSHFSRRNLSDPTTNDLVYHRGTYFNQIYYLNNEPDVGRFVAVSAANTCLDPNNPDDSACWNPRDRNIDQHVSSCFPNPSSQFWQLAPPGFGDTTSCSGGGNPERIQASALAYLYLRLKRQTEMLGRGHIVLPPSPVETLLGSSDTYWQAFFDYVHNGVTVGNCHEDGIPAYHPTTAPLIALHLHRYSIDPEPKPTTDPPAPCGTSLSPLASVAWDASVIRTGVDWYRNRYLGGGALPADVLLSEMGYDWRLGTSDDPPPVADRAYRWSGGWCSFRSGLSWWNSYLCWLTRLAPTECNLQGHAVGAHALHACIHVPNQVPYATDVNYTSTPASDGAHLDQRNQWFLNFDTMLIHVLNNANAIKIDKLAVDQAPYPGAHIFQNSFLRDNNSISWDNKTWRTTPLGACYTVWANVGADDVTNILNTGWVANAVQGIAGTASVSLPAGFSTVFFAVIKSVGTFDPTTASGINFKWTRDDGANRYQGHMSFPEFQDTTEYNYLGYQQVAYSAMVYPVVCKTTTPQTVTVELYRSRSGPYVWLGRPIVLPGICSWFITQ